MYIRVALSILSSLIFAVFVMWFQRSTLLCDRLWGCSISWASNNAQSSSDPYSLCVVDGSWKIYECLGTPRCCQECDNYRITSFNYIHSNKSEDYINIHFQIAQSVLVYSKVCFGSSVLICIFLSIFYVGISRIRQYKQRCISQMGVIKPNHFHKKISILMFLFCFIFMIFYIALFWWGALNLWKRHQSLSHCQIELFHVITWTITCLVISTCLITIILRDKYCLNKCFSFFFTLHVLWSIFLIIYLQGVYSGRWFIDMSS